MIVKCHTSSLSLIGARSNEGLLEGNRESGRGEWSDPDSRPSEVLE